MLPYHNFFFSLPTLLFSSPSPSLSLFPIRLLPYFLLFFFCSFSFSLSSLLLLFFQLDSSESFCALDGWWEKKKNRKNNICISRNQKMKKNKYQKRKTSIVKCSIILCVFLPIFDPKIHNFELINFFLFNLPYVSYRLNCLVDWYLAYCSAVFFFLLITYESYFCSVCSFCTNLSKRYLYKQLMSKMKNHLVQQSSYVHFWLKSHISTIFNIFKKIAFACEKTIKVLKKKNVEMIFLYFIAGDSLIRDKKKTNQSVPFYL